MKIFLAGCSSVADANINLLQKSLFLLESFYYIKPFEMPIIKRAKDFLLDSGAFTFFNNGGKADWSEYIEKYADFIVKNDIEKYFELDIDPLVGYEKVLQYRRKLEKLTNKQCIPVWHKNRGKKEFFKMCDEYNYAAIGGIVSKEIKPEQYNLLPVFIKEAHKRHCSLHGLGFTSTSYFDKIKFDSIDSTTWLVGGRFGNICVRKNEKEMRQKHYAGKKCINPEMLQRYNLQEWINYQKYAERNL